MAQLGGEHRHSAGETTGAVRGSAPAQRRRDYWRRVGDSAGAAWRRGQAQRGEERRQSTSVRRPPDSPYIASGVTRCNAKASGVTGRNVQAPGVTKRNAQASGVPRRNAKASGVPRRNAKASGVARHSGRTTASGRIGKSSGRFFLFADGGNFGAIAGRDSGFSYHNIL